MSELVERLRSTKSLYVNSAVNFDPKDCQEAADRIEELGRENLRLTVAWQQEQLRVLELKAQLDKFVYAEANPDYIDPLIAANTRLREALQEISDDDRYNASDSCGLTEHIEETIRVARKALEQDSG